MNAGDLAVYSSNDTAGNGGTFISYGLINCSSFELNLNGCNGDSATSLGAGNGGTCEVFGDTRLYGTSSINVNSGKDNSNPTDWYGKIGIINMRGFVLCYGEININGLIGSSASNLLGGCQIEKFVYYVIILSADLLNLGGNCSINIFDTNDDGVTRSLKATTGLSLTYDGITGVPYSITKTINSATGSQGLLLNERETYIFRGNGSIQQLNYTNYP
jgi:hypothetical protein